MKLGLDGFGCGFGCGFGALVGFGCGFGAGAAVFGLGGWGFGALVFGGWGFGAAVTGAGLGACGLGALGLRCCFLCFLLGALGALGATSALGWTFGACFLGATAAAFSSLATLAGAALMAIAANTSMKQIEILIFFVFCTQNKKWNNS